MAKAQRVTYFKVTVQDQPGVLLKIMQDLKTKNISLSALWAYGKGEGSAEIFAMAKKPEKLNAALQALGFTAEERVGFFMKGADKAGVLVKSLEALAQANINIKATHAMAVSGKFGALFLFDTADIDKAANILGA